MRQYLLPVIIKPLGVTLRLLIMPCYAIRRGLGECIHDRCDIVNIWLYLRWQLKLTSGWIEVPGYSRIACFSFGPPPRLKWIMRLLMLETSVCSHKLLWALAQLTKLCELLQWQTRRCRGCRWYGLPDRKVLALLKAMSQSSVSQTPCSARNPTEEIESCGEKCANLCRVYKLIMVSRVPDYGQF